MRPLPRRGPALVTAAVLVWLGGAASATAPAAAPAAVPVVASTDVYGDVVERIGGDRVRVVSIISDPSRDPHEYEAEPRTRLELSRAQVVVENGGGYDDFVRELLRGADNPSAEVVTAVEATGRVPDDGGEYNEHVWYDIPGMGRLADRVADALARTAPADAGVFRENASAFKDDLETVRAAQARIAHEHEGTPVAVTEPVPLYLIEACGLRNVTPRTSAKPSRRATRSPRGSCGRRSTWSPRGRPRHSSPTSRPGAADRPGGARRPGQRGPGRPRHRDPAPGTDYVAWMTANVDALARALDT